MIFECVSLRAGIHRAGARTYDKHNILVSFQ